jgi:predicted phage terminase large subunit-like protein
MTAPAAQRLLQHFVDQVGRDPAPRSTFYDFCKRRSVPHWIDGPHLKVICTAVERAVVGAAKGEGVRQMFFAPPRHGKSHAISVNLPVYAMGSYDQFTVIMTSYAAKLAYSKSREARNLMQNIGEQEFERDLARDTWSVSEWAMRGTGSRLLAAGLDGGITGHGALLGIIDDPLKDWRAAHSATIRESAWEWYRTTFSTRLEHGASQILMMTRWHDDDLAGRLLREQGLVDEGGKWEVFRFPCINETDQDVADDPLHRPKGRTLWPARWPQTTMEERLAEAGSYARAAIYQQRPQKPGGSLFKRDRFRYFRSVTTNGAGDKQDHWWELVFGDSVERVAKDRCFTILAVDTALSLEQSADYTAIETWVITPPVLGRRRRLLRHVLRERMEVPDQIPEVEKRCRAERARMAAIEASTAGLATVQGAKRRGVPVRECKADKDKVARALPLQSAYEAETVFHLEDGPWLIDYEDELVAFPTGPHDDMVDAAAYMELVVEEQVEAKQPGVYFRRKE